MTRPVGRPTDYKPEYCELVIELMTEGKSIQHVCREIGVSRSTVQNWAQKYPEFLVALEEGQDLAEAYWQDRGIEGLWNAGKGITFNAGVWKYFMANRFNWREKQDIEQKTEDTSHSKIEIVGVEPDRVDKNNE